MGTKLSRNVRKRTNDSKQRGVSGRVVGRRFLRVTADKRAVSNSENRQPQKREENAPLSIWRESVDVAHNDGTNPVAHPRQIEAVLF